MPGDDESDADRSMAVGVDGRCRETVCTFYALLSGITVPALKDRPESSASTTVAAVPAARYHPGRREQERSEGEHT
jgi:hypothetical protein